MTMTANSCLQPAQSASNVAGTKSAPTANASDLRCRRPQPQDGKRIACGFLRPRSLSDLTGRNVWPAPEKTAHRPDPKRGTESLHEGLKRLVRKLIALHSESVQLTNSRFGQVNSDRGGISDLRFRGSGSVAAEGAGILVPYCFSKTKTFVTCCPPASM
jgi:hypothetical protein